MWKIYEESMWRPYILYIGFFCDSGQGERWDIRIYERYMKKVCDVHIYRLFFWYYQANVQSSNLFSVELQSLLKIVN